MPNHGKYPDELRERAVRMVLDHGHEYGSQWEAICSVAEKLGPKPETVRLWVRQAERDTGRRPGATTEELAELKRLKRENAELRRANDILTLSCVRRSCGCGSRTLPSTARTRCGTS
jgi:transposase